ncbi:hypothetical protein ASG33_01150 [Dyadobacter sp. Leaf189]|nr:hypothetical protein ASG33_01150 [Dyadobacter sp. Leaf189]
MRENNLASAGTELEEIPVNGDPPIHSFGNARNLCFVWPDGGQSFFNYAYLISADFIPGDEMNKIRLGFSSQDVVLEGYRLETLFAQLLDHVPKTITAIEERYIPQEMVEESIVVKIEIEKQEN